MKISQKTKFWQTLKIVTIIYGYPVYYGYSTESQKWKLFPPFIPFHSFTLAEILFSLR